MQTAWKMWPQGRRRTALLGLKSSRQITQVTIVPLWSGGVVVSFLLAFWFVLLENSSSRFLKAVDGDTVSRKARVWLGS